MGLFDDVEVREQGDQPGPQMQARLERLQKMHRVYGKRNDKTCAVCPSFARYGKYSKCKRAGVTASTATDWSGRWNACGLVDAGSGGEK